MFFGPPPIGTSTRQQRQAYIEEKFHCIQNCDMCGLCQIYHGKDPALVYKDYIEGKRDFFEISKAYR